MALTHHQRRVAFHILDVGRQMGASYRDQVAAIATALGEANLGNPWGGEGSSVGWRQEISSYGSAAKRHNVRRVARDFYGEIRHKPGSPAAAAFAVQRPAQRGDYYARYVGQARQIVKELGKGGKGFKGSGGGRGGRLPGTLSGHLRTVPGIDRSAERQQLRLSYLGKSKMPSQGSLLNLASQLRTIQDTPSSQAYDIKRVPGKRVGGVPAGGKSYPHGVGAHGTPNLLIHIGHLAQKMGLHVGENPNFGGVGASHVAGSYHYRNEAVDVSGDPKAMARFAKVVQRRYGRHLAELIHNSPFGAFAVKHGKRVNPSFYSGVWAGHRNHVHIAVSRGGGGTA